ncbi:hypothetical protein [Sphingomonas abietis]|uniref:Uncharacterized protein n=1 Tax=Sphingomonas abietis TaxID=3012344 RepID=A0ABY7NJ90_9SPHN|nr:hypothetical protein [Sphingomonas abietis]WBO21393.1 hypothetical protein PBT88_14520 [Sphingomonas abietis]
MRVWRALIGLGLSLISASAVGAEPVLWNGIEAGTPAEELGSRLFEDSRQTFHALSHHFRMAQFFIQYDNPVQVSVDLDPDRRQVCGVDIEGARAEPELRALIGEFGRPASRLVQRPSVARPVGAPASIDAGPSLQIWTWRRGRLVVMFRERPMAGDFQTLYRLADGREALRPC